MGKFREICKKIIRWLRQLPIHAQKKINVFQRGRGTIKYSFFYRYVSYFLLVQSLISLFIGLAMIWPTWDNPFFDFNATAESDFMFDKGDVCSVESRPIFKFWKGLQNYSVLAQLLFCQSIIFFASSVLMFLLSMGYRHFAYVERERFANPSFKTKWLGWFVKRFPSILKFSYILLFILLVVPFYLFIIGSTCEFRVPSTQDIDKIRNCRLWLFKCVGDTRFFGRQFECSKTENFSMFPGEVCAHEPDGETKCNFPISDKEFGVASHICGAKDSTADGFGALPICPMCTNAREDPSTKVYSPRYKENLEKILTEKKNAGAGLPTSYSYMISGMMDSSKKSEHPCPVESYLFLDFYKNDPWFKHAKGRRRSAAINDLTFTIGDGLPTCPAAGAFRNAYNKVMFLIHQGSYVGRVLYGWSFIAFVVFFAIRLLGWYIHIIVVEDPSFFTPAQGGVIRRGLHSFFKNMGL